MMATGDQNHRGATTSSWARTTSNYPVTTVYLSVAIVMMIMLMILV